MAASYAAIARRVRLVASRCRCDRPTSCAFGGPDRATLFITTASHGLDEAALARQPDAGRVFRLDGLGVRGESCAVYAGNVEPVPGPT